MAYTSTYLNFVNQTKEAFEFYRSVFGGEFEGPIGHFRDIPLSPDMPEMSNETKDLIMHICLPILGGHKLMGADAPEAMGLQVIQGNNFWISLHPDSREETDRLFTLLSEDGATEQPPTDMFWGAYYGNCRDKYGIQWVFNCEA